MSRQMSRTVVGEDRIRFVKALERATGSRSIVDVFTDTVHMMACALWAPFAPDRKAVEGDFAGVWARYSDSQHVAMQESFAILSDALTSRREEFLGTVLEGIGAANTHNGQFLTPVHIARLMAKICDPCDGYRPGRLITLNDPACGASVLMIEQAEELVHNKGVRQSDIYIEVGDVDGRACDISFIELTLLGYAAKVEHMDALTRREYSAPRYTAGYFIHGLPMRRLMHGLIAPRGGSSTEGCRAESPVETEVQPVARVVQGELGI